MSLSVAQREAYQRDGAIMLKGVLDTSWIERMRAAIADYDGSDTRTLWMSRLDSRFSAFARECGLAQVAGELMGVEEVYFFYDQLFVRLPKGDAPTPLHQDLPYWPVDGSNIISIWVPFDEVTTESGVVQYVKGSHLWGRMFEPAAFSKEHKRGRPGTASAGYEFIEDPDALIAENMILSWKLGPGDVLVHHPRTLHFATPNLTASQNRRAIALRYVGPQTSFVDRPGNFLHLSQARGLPGHWASSPGHGVDISQSGSNYPMVWQAENSASTAPGI